MNRNVIIKNMRISLLRKMLLPALLLLVCIACYSLVSRIPIRERLYPESISEDADLKALHKQEIQYVTVMPETLYYSGCDYTKNGKVAGHFYYSLTDNFCRFYLLEAAGSELPKQKIDSMQLKGQVIESGVFQDLVTVVAEQLEWTADGLTELSDAYMISTLEYWNPWQLAFLLLYLLCVTAAAMDMLITLFYLVFPLWAPAFRRLRKYGDVGLFISKAEQELRHMCQVSAHQMYVTPGYFININMLHTLVVPLEQVVWIYTHGQLHKRLGSKRMLSSTIHMVMSDGSICECGGKRREDADEVLQAVSLGHCEILIGYSDENKRLARERRQKRTVTK